MVTIMDVARAAGVGIGTVSRVINGSSLVSGATRQRVLDAIQRLGYTPNPIARAFGGRRTDKIEVLVPLFAQAFALELLRGIQDALAETDYSLRIRTVDDLLERNRVYDQCCLRGRTEGVIVLWMAPTQRFVQRLTANAIPTVLLNSSHPHLWSIGIDHADSADQAVTYCAGLGHRRIALVDRGADPFDPTSPGICHTGYTRAMARAGLDIPDGYDRVAAVGAAGGAAAFTQLVDLQQLPTAVIAGSEAQALGIVNAARSRGLRVPEDISVVGYNDTQLSRDFGLTTMQLPLQELATSAAETLVMLLADPESPPQARHLRSQLVVRRTCAPPRN